MEHQILLTVFGNTKVFVPKLKREKAKITSTLFEIFLWLGPELFRNFLVASM